ncbi:pyruvate formate lyase family protein [Terrisporobacter mayombei]|nr:pyruvate formate lyase family protein [Terrisporobacter mayombei]MCC3868984.1 hypothetical protein [Terrisporobacter mayombei]
MSEEETDDVRSKELKKISDVCYNVPANLSRNFYKNIQLAWFT